MRGSPCKDCRTGSRRRFRTAAPGSAQRMRHVPCPIRTAAPLSNENQLMVTGSAADRESRRGRARRDQQDEHPAAYFCRKQVKSPTLMTGAVVLASQLEKWVSCRAGVRSRPAEYCWRKQVKSPTLTRGHCVL